MICKHIITSNEYNYEFTDNDLVKLSNPESLEIFYEKYEDWCRDYIIIDKWNSL